MTDMTVANTILKQLGGIRLKTMTGASKFTGHENKLTFFIPSRAGKPNHISIELLPNDTYEMVFGTVRGLQYKITDTFTGVYADDLQSTFTEVTGLATHL